MLNYVLFIIIISIKGDLINIGPGYAEGECWWTHFTFNVFSEAHWLNCFVSKCSNRLSRHDDKQSHGQWWEVRVSGSPVFLRYRARMWLQHIPSEPVTWLRKRGMPPLVILWAHRTLQDFYPESLESHMIERHLISICLGILSNEHIFQSALVVKKKLSHSNVGTFRLSETWITAYHFLQLAPFQTGWNIFALWCLAAAVENGSLFQFQVPTITQSHCNESSACHK